MSLTPTPDNTAVVLGELDRIECLPVVQEDARADSFATGARWATRMVREAIERGAPAETAGLLEGS